MYASSSHLKTKISFKNEAIFATDAIGLRLLKHIAVANFHKAFRVHLARPDVLATQTDLLSHVVYGRYTTC